MEERTNRSNAAARSEMRRARSKSAEAGSFAKLGNPFSHDEGGGPLSVVHKLISALVIVACLLVVLLLAFIVLSHTNAFLVTEVTAKKTAHLSAKNIVKLASVEEGSTLLNLDTKQIKENLAQNPWVKDATLHREFPNRLAIEVEERKAQYLVKMSAGSVCWRLGSDYIWIEPANLSVENGESAEMHALALAKEEGAILIYGVPSSMHPSAGEVATDEVIKAVGSYQEQFSADFAKQIVCYSAASSESIACFLQSGIEISLGSPTSVDVKEAVVQEIIKENKDQVVYINVRIPSQPAYRKLDLDNVEAGTGVQIDLQSTTTDTSATSPSDGAGAAEGQGDAEGQPQDQTQVDSQELPQDQTQVDSQEQTQELDTSRMVLGDDGNYYTYEEVYGYTYEQYWGLE